MKRDKTIIVVLSVLLVLSLGAFWAQTTKTSDLKVEYDAAEATLVTVKAEVVKAEAKTEDAQDKASEFDACTKDFMNLDIWTHGNIAEFYIDEMSPILICYDKAAGKKY